VPGQTDRGPRVGYPCHAARRKRDVLSMGQGVADRVRGQSGSQRRKRQDAYQGHRDDVRGYGASRHPAVNGEDVAGGYLADYAPSYVRAVYGRLPQILCDAVHDGLLPRNPCSRKTAPPAEDRPAIRLATTEQVWSWSTQC